MMTYFADLSDYTYHLEFCRPGTKNIGWMGRRHNFEIWNPPDEIMEKIWRYCEISIAETRGVHECEICGLDSANFAERNGNKILLGTSEIRVFSGRDEIYAAPTMIYHYVQSHGYKPPDGFIAALTDGPAPGSKEYCDRLKELNLEWGATLAPLGERFSVSNAISGGLRQRR
jgi:hypothetical protein